MLLALLTVPTAGLTAPGQGAPPPAAMQAPKRAEAAAKASRYAGQWAGQISMGTMRLANAFLDLSQQGKGGEASKAALQRRFNELSGAISSPYTGYAESLTGVWDNAWIQSKASSRMLDLASASMDLYAAMGETATTAGDGASDGSKQAQGRLQRASQAYGQALGGFLVALFEQPGFDYRQFFGAMPPAAMVHLSLGLRTGLMFDPDHGERPVLKFIETRGRPLFGYQITGVRASTERAFRHVASWGDLIAAVGNPSGPISLRLRKGADEREASVRLLSAR